LMTRLLILSPGLMSCLTVSLCRAALVTFSGMTSGTSTASHPYRPYRQWVVQSSPTELPTSRFVWITVNQGKTSVWHSGRRRLLIGTIFSSAGRTGSGSNRSILLFCRWSLTDLDMRTRQPLSRRRHIILQPHEIHSLPGYASCWIIKKVLDNPLSHQAVLLGCFRKKPYSRHSGIDPTSIIN
jgi:hypothetical protein